MINVHQSPTQERRENAISQNRAISFFNNYLNSLKGERVAIFHHTDPDGISSGVILGRIVKKFTGKEPALHPTTYNSLRDSVPLQQIKKGKITKALFIDLGIDGHQEFVKKLSGTTSWFLIDHHELYRDSDNILKPQKFTTIPASRYPCGKLSFDLAKSYIDTSSMDWIACLGIVGDHAWNQWKDFLDETFKKYGWKTNNNYYETIPGMVCRFITSVESTGDKKKLMRVVNILRKARGPEDVLRSPLQKIHEKVEREINDTVKSIEEDQKGRKYIYAEIKTKYYIKSPVSSILGVHNPDRTVITVSKDGDRYEISGRRSDGKYPINALIRNCLDRIPNAEGGGHPQAAGGSVPEKYYHLFKKKIIGEMERQD